MTSRAISLGGTLVMAENIEKVKFKCPHCGCKLSVPADRVGKRGRCPRCQERLTVPGPSETTPAEAPLAAAPDSGAAELNLISPVLDSALLDVSRPPASESDRDESQETYEQLRTMEGRGLLKEKEEPPQRPLPWIIDIFLYPLNGAALTILGIAVGIPMVLRVLLFTMAACTALFPPAVVFCVLLLIITWGGTALLWLYMNWYASECIRDSAQGNIRAADTVATTPGLGEIFGEMFRTLVCILACVAPALVYRNVAGQTDVVFGALLGVGGFLLPMALLATTMLESLWALNPIQLIGSILSTFLSYGLLVPLCYALLALFPLAFYFVATNWFPGYLLLFTTYYVWLVLAHLLGRLYWKHQERLNWAA